MSAQISYLIPVQVAIFAVAADLYWTRGSTTSAFALGVLGNLGLEIGYKYYHAREKNPPYRVFKQRGFPSAALTDKQAVERALARLHKDYPMAYRRFLKENGLVSEEAAIVFTQKAFKEGCCAGTVNAIFDKIVRGTCRTLEEGVRDLQNEDVFYFQLLEYLFPQYGTDPHRRKTLVEAKIRVEQLGLKTIELKQFNKAERQFNRVAYSMDDLRQMEEMKSQRQVEFDQQLSKKQEQIAIERVKKFEEKEKEIEYMHRRDLKRTFLKSQVFSIHASTTTYREFFEQTMSPLGQQDIIGAIHIPKHVMGFQYGPRGYLFWDTLDPSIQGLFQYPDAETFFKEVRKHVLDDSAASANLHAGEEGPDARKRVIKEMQVQYAIHPLKKS